MIKELYTITCLTNLHVGSGEANFNIIDKEVEKDPITGYPMIHSSGIKGAIRDAYAGTEEEIAAVFGAPGRVETDLDGKKRKVGNVGACKFFNAYLLCRPLRASGKAPCINVTTVKAINDYIALTEAFGLSTGIAPLRETLDFGDNLFLCSADGIQVEAEPTGKLAPDEAEIGKLRELLGGEFAIAKSLDDFDLPVIARNNLQSPNGNLWYEEYVPRGSKFYMLLVADKAEAVIPELVQLGGNASIGYGYCRFERKAQVQE